MSAGKWRLYPHPVVPVRFKNRLDKSEAFDSGIRQWRKQGRLMRFAFLGARMQQLRIVAIEIGEAFDKTFRQAGNQSRSVPGCMRGGMPAIDDTRRTIQRPEVQGLG